MLGSEDVELQIQRADRKVMHGFPTVQELELLNPKLFKDQLQFESLKRKNKTMEQN